MATLFGKTITAAQSNRIKAAYGKKLRDDGQPATAAQMEAYFWQTIKAEVGRSEYDAVIKEIPVSEALGV